MQNYNNVGWLTICSDGAYLGKTNDKRFDLFRFNNIVYKVERNNPSNTTAIPDSLVEFLLGVSN